MIVKIMKGGSSFSAIYYNENKVNEGQAHLIAKGNLGYLKYKPLNLYNITNYFSDVSNQNRRVKNKQFHCVISEKGYSKTANEMKIIAEEFLHKMGYSNSPYLVYQHNDTDNNHIHIVASRVDLSRKSINRDYERIKSQKVMAEILQLDIKSDFDRDLNNLLAYKFSTEAQMKEVLGRKFFISYSPTGIKLTYKKDTSFKEYISKESVAKMTTKEKVNREEKRRLKAIILKYSKHSKDAEMLRKILHQKTGIELLLYKNKEGQYSGYSVLDHKNKRGYKGSDIVKLKEIEANYNTINIEEKMALILEDIVNLKDDELTTEKLIDLLESNNLLLKIVGLQYIIYDRNNKNASLNLDKEHVGKIRKNDIINKARSFNLSSIRKLDAISKYYNIDSELLLTDDKKEKREELTYKERQNFTILVNWKKENTEKEIPRYDFIFDNYGNIQFMIDKYDLTIFDVKEDIILKESRDNNLEQNNNELNNALKNIFSGGTSSGLKPKRKKGHNY